MDGSDVYRSKTDFSIYIASQYKSLFEEEEYLYNRTLFIVLFSIELLPYNKFYRSKSILESGRLIFDSHNKIITKACAFIQTLDKNIGLRIFNLLKRLKEYRELFSYKHPSSGFRSLKYSDTFLAGVNLPSIATHCNLICEIAQFASECFEVLVRRKLSDKTFSYDYPTLEKAFEYNGLNYFFLDEQDARRLYYTIDDIGHPLNIYHSIKPGWVEDFFSSWYSNKSNRLLNPTRWEIRIFRFYGIDGS
jgi:hypothetical protein